MARSFSEGREMIVSPKIERLLKTTHGFDRVRRISLVRRLVAQALKAAPDLDLKRNAPRTVNALDESGTAYTSETVVAEFTPPVTPPPTPVSWQGRAPTPVTHVPAPMTVVNVRNNAGSKN